MCMKANKLHVCPFNSLLTLLICLQCCDKDFPGDISRDVLYDPGVKVDLISIVFSRCLSSIPSALKKMLEAINV